MVFERVERNASAFVEQSSKPAIVHEREAAIDFDTQTTLHCGLNVAITTSDDGVIRGALVLIRQAATLGFNETSCSEKTLDEV